MNTITMCMFAGALLVGCAGEGRQTGDANLSFAKTNTIATEGWPTLGAGTARFIRIDLGADNFAECRRISPKFPFDSAMTYAQDREQVLGFASCLNAPGMRERTILLVGRADQSGSAPYNEELGMKRASTIKQILLDAGIDESRISVATAGEQGALGKEPEYAPGYDRRVDVIVKGGVHAP